MNLRLRQFAGWCGLLLYLGAASPMGMGLAGVLGGLDPDHRALVQADPSGTKLVLRHAQQCRLHQHGLLARTLTLFAEPVRASQPDHVLQIGSGETAARPQHFLTPAPASVALPEFAAVETPLDLLRESNPTGDPTHPPPSGGGQLLCLRSTVLLI